MLNGMKVMLRPLTPKEVYEASQHLQRERVRDKEKRLLSENCLLARPSKLGYKKGKENVVADALFRKPFESMHDDVIHVMLELVNDNAYVIDLRVRNPDLRTNPSQEGEDDANPLRMEGHPMTR
ncbi:hypothetical protein AAHA92_31097 [Salvia divinorum]|uniref:Uncharacterized protein n=1 Tax=Salvia divinorum TaxID=28513 RepID=A0ABD1FT15_SALDI